MNCFKKTQFMLRMTTITQKYQAAQKTNSPAPQVSALRWKGGKSQEESEDSTPQCVLQIQFIANPKIMEIVAQVRPES